LFINDVINIVKKINYSEIWLFLPTNLSLAAPSPSPDDYEPQKQGQKAAEQLMGDQLQQCLDHVLQSDINVSINHKCDPGPLWRGCIQTSLSSSLLSNGPYLTSLYSQNHPVPTGPSPHKMVSSVLALDPVYHMGELGEEGCGQKCENRYFTSG
jgi:hypothetical protein